MGRKSAADRLPEKLRGRLLEMLHDPAVTQAEITDSINDEAGDRLLSKSSVNRYAQRMKRFAEKNRQAKEIADAYIEKYGSDNRQKLGRVINEQMRVAVFDLMSEFDEIRTDPEMKGTDAADMLYKISRGLKELEQAEKLNAERTENIRKETLAEAAEVVERAAKSDDDADKALELIKKRIMGL